MYLGRIIICSLAFSLNVAGQEPVSADSIHSTGRCAALKGKLQQVQHYLDTKAKAQVDTNYIEIPAKPWRVILRNKENLVDVRYNNSIEFPDEGEYVDWQMRFAPPVAASIGLWVGYRGIGLSYSKSIAKNAGRYFSISANGARYGFSFQLRRFSTDKTTVKAKEYKDGQLIGEDSQDTETYAPIWIRSIYMNGYYVFNGRHYSQAAAYTQSAIQRHSAGSFLVGASWNQSSLDYSDPKNAGVMLLCHNTGSIKVQQGNIGIGYGYNFVPMRGLVINAMVMPSVSVFNRVKVNLYDSNYDLSSAEGQTDDYGQWDPQTRTWANGKTHKPFELTDEEGKWVEGADAWKVGSETKYSAGQFNVEARIGIAYNWSNYFVGLMGKFNYFSYKKGSSKVDFFDGFARVSLGVRL